MHDVSVCACVRRNRITYIATSDPIRVTVVVVCEQKYFHYHVSHSVVHLKMCVLQ